MSFFLSVPFHLSIALANQDEDSERRYMILRNEDEESGNQERGSEEEDSVTSVSCRQLCTFISLALALIMDNASYYMKEPFFPVVVNFLGFSLFPPHRSRMITAASCSPVYDH